MLQIYHKRPPDNPMVSRRGMEMRSTPYSVPDRSTVRTAVVAIVLFVAAHFALLVGVTTPDKFYVDADLGGISGNVDGDLQPADDFPELDLSEGGFGRKAVAAAPMC
jgi:hypothetical protein